MKKSLLIVAHGSRRNASNDEVKEIAEMITENFDNRFYSVDVAFLELAKPSIDDAIECLVKDGVQRIMVVPYFLAAGTHVVNDIPKIIEKAIHKYPEVKVSLSEHIGSSPMMTDLIMQSAEKCIKHESPPVFLH